MRVLGVRFRCALWLTETRPVSLERLSDPSGGGRSPLLCLRLTRANKHHQVVASLSIAADIVKASSLVILVLDLDVMGTPLPSGRNSLSWGAVC